MTRRGLLLFVALGIVWGIPYAFIKIAVGEIEPTMLVLGRTAVGAVLLVPIALWRRELLPVLRRWKPLLAYTVAEIVFPWAFLNSAETRLPSSTTGLLLAAVPIAGIGISVLFGRGLALQGRNWIGVVIGMAGVATIVGLDVGGSDLIGVLELIVTVVGYALGPAILSRWMGDLPGIGVVAASLLLAAVIYLPVVSIAGAWPTAVPSGAAIASVAVLGVICTAVAFVLFFAVIREIGPVRVTAVTYINPAVAVLLGILWLGEPWGVGTIIGFVLVLAGSFLVTWRPRAADTMGIAEAPTELRTG